MTETARRDRRSPAPWGLLGMLALVAAIEQFGMRGNLDFMNNVAVSWAFTGRHVARRAPGKAILCFGDSMLKFGILPRVVGEKTGERAHSLALQSGSAPSSYFLLRRALDAGARPRAVVVDFARGILGDGPASVSRPYPWSELLTLRETLDLCRTARDPELLATLAVRSVLYSYRGRFEVRDNIKAALRGRRTGQRDIAPALWRNWNANEGGQANPKVGPFADVVIPDNAPIKPGTWRCDPVNAQYVRRFLELAASRGITVYWLLPPVTPGTLSHWVHSGDERLYVDFVRGEQARFPNLVVLDGRYSGYERPVFVDGVHLDRDGAAALSAGVGEVLRREMHRAARDRLSWVRLPAFSDRPTVLPIEDVGQSQIVLKTLLGTRRR
jgi:hypothetical protein